MTAVKIDIVSDIMCPWCIIGFKRLELALASLGDQISAQIEWHPFELNPQMPVEGQNTTEHLMEKYGGTREGFAQTREQMTGLGAELEISFNFSDRSHMWNTFDAHRVLHWAREQGKQVEFKLALFDEHFTQGNNPSDPDVLADVANRLGLDGDEAAAIARSDRFAAEVRAEQQHFTSLGITAVPNFIINNKYAIPGAQSPETLANALLEISRKTP